MTAPFTKATDCVGAVVYPMLPGPKPDLFGSMLDSGAELGEKSADEIAQNKESLKDALYTGKKLFGKRRTTALAKNLERQAQNAKALGTVFNAVGKVAIAADIYNNVKKGCKVE